MPQMRLGGAIILGRQALDDRRRELLILLAMRLDAGTYEWAQHVEIGQTVGVSQAPIGASSRLDLNASALSEGDGAVLGFGRQAVEQVRVAPDVTAFRAIGRP